MEFDPATSTYFIRLPPPYTNITLTPGFLEDAPIKISSLNNPAVYMNLSGPPYPYTESDCANWFKTLSATNDAALSQYLLVQASRSAKEGDAGEQGVNTSEGKKWVDGLPVSAIREDGKFIGEFSVNRRGFSMIRDENERKKMKEFNASLPAGDPRIEYEIGCKSLLSFPHFPVPHFPHLTENP